MVALITYEDAKIAKMVKEGCILSLGACVGIDRKKDAFLRIKDWLLRTHPEYL